MTALALVLHAHLPFVRHPEHARSLEEAWLYEAVAECYIPIVRMLQNWEHEGIPAVLTLSVTPTLAAMLSDSFLQERCEQHLRRFVELCELEVHRTLLNRAMQSVSLFYLERAQATLDWYLQSARDLLTPLARLQFAGRIEIIGSSATHAVLPLLRNHPGGLRAQIFVGRDSHRAAFGTSPAGFWLPECAWAPELDPVLSEAGMQWTVTDSHALEAAEPHARYSVFAPVITPRGMAVFGRDSKSARQVWSRSDGYPGDVWYREFYRDVGFDADADYVAPYLPVRGKRSFTGLKYHRITGGNADKQLYDRAAALARAREHGRHFVQCRLEQLRAAERMVPHPILTCPYDAELFGHWWFEGPEFLDAVAREAQEQGLTLTTPGAYLREHRMHQAAMPGASSWGEAGYWKVWLNEKNHWMTPALATARTRMQKLAAQASLLADPMRLRALRQAGRELLLAEASDWPFIVHTGTSPEYAARRLKAHLLRFTRLCDQMESGTVDPQWLAEAEALTPIFPGLDTGYWAFDGTTAPNAPRSTQP